MSNEEENICPACGGYVRTGIEVGAYILCSRCGSKENIDTALEVAKSKHREKLKQIWAELEKEE